MTRALFVPVRSKNPYIELLSTGLRAAGVEVEYAADFPSEAWLWRHRSSVDIIHIHWVQPLYRAGPFTPLKFVRWAFQLWLARRLGYTVIWTAHNLMPHQSRSPLLDRWGRALLVTQIDAIIAHCDAAREQVSRRFGVGTERIFRVEHGHYLDSYARATDRAQARQSLGLAEEAFVFLFLGAVKAYKGVDELIEVFRRLPGTELRLIIAGMCLKSAFRERLEAFAAEDDRIDLQLSFVEDALIPLYFGAADVSVIPFRSVLTSGSAILSLSQGSPVVAPAMGCLTELITPQIGRLYPADAVDGLYNAMIAIQKQDSKQMGKDAAAYIAQKRFQWDAIGESTRAVYDAVLEVRP